MAQRQKADDLFISAVTRAEIELGIALLPAGKRRKAFEVQARGLFGEDFAGRCLPFDKRCARPYAELVASRTREGRPVSVEDAQIASVAVVNRQHMATRHTADFENIDGLQLINPWIAE